MTVITCSGIRNRVDVVQANITKKETGTVHVNAFLSVC